MTDSPKHSVSFSGQKKRNADDIGAPMIPSILTDTGGGTSARNSKPTQEAEAETTQTFGDVFGSAETEEAEAVQSLLGTDDDSPELAFAMAEDPRALKPPISPNVSSAVCLILMSHVIV
ncbi:MAG: hypothetical protein NWR52_06930, partial [Paracoccaceae bacterium]|nr:hypothetical protein [Paracoccaceae bacterium]